MSAETWEGGCLCGQVRFEATGAPKWVKWCHCQSCRRHSGAAASTFASFEVERVKLTAGEILKFNSSPGTTRGWCPRCGSTLTCESIYLPTEVHMHVGSFDRAGDLAPRGAFFAEERLPWFPGHD